VPVLYVLEMKYLNISLLIILSLQLSNGEENKDTSIIGILEALTLAINEAPKGKEIQAIERFEISDGKYAFYAVYGEEVIPYTRKEIGPDGNYVEVEKYRKEKIGVEISMTGKIKVDVLQRERTKPERRMISKDRVLPSRRVILEEN